MALTKKEAWSKLETRFRSKGWTVCVEESSFGFYVSEEDTQNSVHVVCSDGMQWASIDTLSHVNVRGYRVQPTRYGHGDKTRTFRVGTKNGLNYDGIVTAVEEMLALDKEAAKKRKVQEEGWLIEHEAREEARAEIQRCLGVDEFGSTHVDTEFGRADLNAVGKTDGDARVKMTLDLPAGELERLLKLLGVS